MAYHVDKNDENAIVMDGHSQGIAKSPYEGISDMRNVNIISIPDEASVGFATSKISPPALVTGNMTSANAGTDTITFDSISGIESGMCITFSAVTGGIGLSTSTPYWLGSVTSTTAKLYTSMSLDASTLVDITNTGTGTFTFYSITGSPKYFTKDSRGNYWTVTSTGLVWTNTFTTSSGYWTYAGNTTLTNASGNGIVAYRASDGTEFVFVFRNSAIDYVSLLTVPVWTYGWKPSDGSTANASGYLKTASGTNNNHMAQVEPDNKVYYTDANWIGRWYQADPTVAFVPTTTSTYVFDQTAVLPFNDIANCIAPSGNNLLIGGQKNIVYPWDTFDQLPNFPIFIAENNIVNMVTVNTNTYIFAGQRGRIYVTNGSQANLWAKMPDHLSGTVEPYYTWGGAATNKNQLYFSASVTNNAGIGLTTMGGLWAIDLDTNALRLINQLSYATYAGYATAIIPITSTSGAVAGTGLYIGWNNGNSGYGIDVTTGIPYTGSQAYIDYDLIPIGTFYRPKQFKTVEYKLSVPMVTGESVSLYYRELFSDSYTLIFTSNGTTGNGSISDNSPVNFDNAQWIQIRAVLNSTSSSPSYTRLREVRIK